jgi:hypothetical protein
VFSDEKGQQSYEEYTSALAWLSDIKGVIEDRERRAAAGPGADAIVAEEIRQAGE